MKESDQIKDARFNRASLPQHFAGFSKGPVTWDALLNQKSSLNNAKKSSAVALLFLPPQSNADGAARLVLTRRSHSVRTHKGQIGLAGGRLEEGDVGPADTVLREIHEEIGIAPGEVSIHGVLEPVTALDGSLVVPVIATAFVAESALIPEEAEVAAIYLCEWTRFASETAKRFSFTIFGIRRESLQFGEHPFATDSVGAWPYVWGLTAQILAQASMR